MIRRNNLVASLKSSGLIQDLKAALALLTPVERRTALFLILSMNVNAVLGLVGLAGIIPFVHLMLDPAPLDGPGRIASAFRWLGFREADTALGTFGIILIATIIVKNAYAWVHAGRQQRFCAAAETRLATELLDRIVHAPYGWLVRQNSSVLRDIVVGQSIEWSRGVVRTLLQIINDLLFMALAFTAIIVASPVAGLAVTFAGIMFAAVLGNATRGRIARLTDEKRTAIRVGAVTAGEAIAGGRDVRISGAGPLLVASFAEDMRRYSLADSDSRQWQMIPRLGLEVIGFAALIGVSLGALWSGTPRADIAGLLALFAVVAMRAIPIIGQLAGSASGLLSALPAVNEICRLRDELPARPEEGGTGVGPIDWRSLALDHVSFAYTPETPRVLGPISLVIQRSRSYGIVGASGAGKSTLVDLIAGLLDPSEGRILLDDRELTKAQRLGWRRRIAYVAQTPFLIDATLIENIEFGQPAPPDRQERLTHVIAAAGLDGVVRGLEHGLNTRLGERGVRLSGGQRQRVAIARALYRDAELLILDEATSALDALTEREVSESLQALTHHSTVIFIAHRLSTVVRCDELIVMDAGRVVATGSHSDLMQRDPTYRKMVDAHELVTT